MKREMNYVVWGCILVTVLGVGLCLRTTPTQADVSAILALDPSIDEYSQYIDVLEQKARTMSIELRKIAGMVAYHQNAGIALDPDMIDYFKSTMATLADQNTTAETVIAEIQAGS